MRQVREDAARGQEDADEDRADTDAEQHAAKEVGRVRTAEQGRERKQADARHDERDGDDGDSLALEPLDAREHLDHLVVVVRAQVLALVLLAVEQLAHGDAEGVAQLVHDAVVGHALAALPLRDGLARDAELLRELRLREVQLFALAGDEHAGCELVHDGPPGARLVDGAIVACRTRRVHRPEGECGASGGAIAECVRKTDEVTREPDMGRLKIYSEVASDNDKSEFMQVLRTGRVDPSWKSRYAQNFSLFCEKIEMLVSEWPTSMPYFATRIMNNAILLPIEAESQNTALRIFSTLNDRGLPLSDADIFKSQFYKYFSYKGEKDDFVKRWKQLEEGASGIFHPMRGTPPWTSCSLATCTSNALIWAFAILPRRRCATSSVAAGRAAGVLLGGGGGAWGGCADYAPRSCRS